MRAAAGDNPLPMEELTLSCAAVRELDRRATLELGVPSIVLMENAGRACALEALALLDAPAGGTVAVCAGPGNNGGDGFVVARTLVNRGHDARVLFLGDEARLARGSHDLRTNARAWRAMGGGVTFLAGTDGLAALRAALREAPLVVDALFGTGLARPLEGEARAVVEALEAEADRRSVLAVDVPSGLDADTGAVLGAAVRATCTVTFVARKPGLLCGEGPARAGRVVVAEIGIPRPLLEEARRAAASAGRGPGG